MKKAAIKLSNFEEHFSDWLKQGKFLENLLQAGKFLYNENAKSDIDIEMLDMSEVYFEKFRSEGNINEICNVGNPNWDIAQGLRRVAHILHRHIKKQHKNKPANQRFLVSIS